MLSLLGNANHHFDPGPVYQPSLIAVGLVQIQSNSTGVPLVLRQSA